MGSNGSRIRDDCATSSGIRSGRITGIGAVSSSGPTPSPSSAGPNAGGPSDVLGLGQTCGSGASGAAGVTAATGGGLTVPVGPAAPTHGGTPTAPAPAAPPSTARG